MLPWIILAVVAVPVLVVAFAATRRKTQAVEYPAGDTAAEHERIEHEFEDAEAFQEKWREEEHRKHPPESGYQRPVLGRTAATACCVALLAGAGFAQAASAEGSFESSDAFVNKIWRGSVQTATRHGLAAGRPRPPRPARST